MFDVLKQNQNLQLIRGTRMPDMKIWTITLLETIS